MSLLLINSVANRIPLADKSVHMIATSPPYFGLRDYGLPPTVWPSMEYVPMAGLPAVSVPEWVGCLGLEPDPVMFVAHIVHVMREARRVLRDDGVAWVNFGDSYSGGGRGGNGDKITGRAKNASQLHHFVASGTKPKDLMGIPWRIAFALQADGWYLRSDVIWAKDNPMPNSVNGWRWERHRMKVAALDRGEPGQYLADAYNGRPMAARDGRDFKDQSGKYTDCPGCDKCVANDGYVLRRGSWRPTTAHEYIFMLAKSDRYYADREAVAEEAVGTGGGPFSDKYADAQPDHGGRSQHRRGKNEELGKRTYDGFNERWEQGTADGYPETRNKRSVWNVNPKPYPGAHFATWPPDLVEPMIKSSTSERGVCPDCGAPWVRVVDKGQPQMRPDNPNPVRPYDAASGYSNGTGSTTLHMTRVTETVDWRPSCHCPEHAPVPAVVLDIFAGSGTTLQVARQLGRHGIGLDLSFNYLQNEARDRLKLSAVDALVNGAGVATSSNGKGRKPKSGQISLPLFQETL